MVRGMQLRDLAGLALTYPEVGATAATLPAGYKQVRLSRRIGTGRDRFDQAADVVMRYGMLRGAGLRVTATTEVAQVGVSTLGKMFSTLRLPAKSFRVTSDRLPATREKAGALEPA